MAARIKVGWVTEEDLKADEPAEEEGEVEAVEGAEAEVVEGAEAEAADPAPVTE